MPTTTELTPTVAVALDAPLVNSASVQPYSSVTGPIVTFNRTFSVPAPKISAIAAQMAIHHGLSALKR